MVVVRLQCISGCGKSMIKVQQKYAESKAYVWLKYGKSTVRYGKSIVLYGNFFLALTIHIIYTYIMHPSLLLHRD